MKKLLLPLLTAALIVGCASTGNSQLGQMDNQQINALFKDGHTTKDQVTAALGQPNAVDIDNNGREKWTYAYTKSTAKVINFVPVASAFKSGTNDSTKQLVILFDDEGIMKKHVFSTATGETTVGIIG